MHQIKIYHAKSFLPLWIGVLQCKKRCIDCGKRILVGVSFGKTKMKETTHNVLLLVITDHFIHQIPPHHNCKNAPILLKEKHTPGTHFNITPAILHWCPTEQPRLTVTWLRSSIWWKRGCVTTAATANCSRRVMHVGFSIATVWPIAMTDASSYGRPVSQKWDITFTVSTIFKPEWSFASSLWLLFTNERSLIISHNV